MLTGLLIAWTVLGAICMAGSLYIIAKAVPQTSTPTGQVPVFLVYLAMTVMSFIALVK